MRVHFLRNWRGPTWNTSMVDMILEIILRLSPQSTLLEQNGSCCLFDGACFKCCPTSIHPCVSSGCPDYSASVGRFASLLFSLSRVLVVFYQHLTRVCGWLMAASYSYEDTMIQWRTKWALGSFTLHFIPWSHAAFVAISGVHTGWKGMEGSLPHIQQTYTRIHTQEHLVLCEIIIIRYTKYSLPNACITYTSYTLMTDVISLHLHFPLGMKWSCISFCSFACRLWGFQRSLSSSLAFFLLALWWLTQLPVALIPPLHQLSVIRRYQSWRFHLLTNCNVKMAMVAVQLTIQLGLSLF